MSIGHLAIRVHSRTRGHTVAAALAYRLGERIACSRTGSVHDYARRSARAEIAASGITAGPWTDPGSLAAAMECAEKRRDSTLLRDVQIALPHELPDERRAALARSFAERLAERFCTTCAWAVHRPDQRGDHRNHHAHVVLPTRRLEGDEFGAKLRELDDRRGGRSRATVRAIRELWQDLANAELERAALAARVDTGRNAEGAPQPTLGVARTSIERRAWRKRNPDEQLSGLSAAQLVADGHATGAGRRLARHTRYRRRLARARERMRARTPAPDDAGAATPEAAAALDAAKRVRALPPAPAPPTPVRVPNAAQERPQAVVRALPPPPAPPTPVRVPSAAQEHPQAVVRALPPPPAPPTPVVVPSAAQEQMLEAHERLSRYLTPSALESAGELLIERDPHSVRGQLSDTLQVDGHTRTHVAHELEAHTRPFRLLRKTLADWRAWWRDGERGQRIAREIFARVWPTHWLEEGQWETTDRDEQARIVRELDDQAARRKRERETAEQAARAPPRSRGIRRD